MNTRTKQILSLISSLAIALLSGCASGNASRNANVIAGGALGAAIANEASEGDAAWTIGGAALGAMASVAANEVSKNHEQRAYRAGYEAALNQSVKQQYWIIQNRQKEDATNQGAETGTFVPVVIPEQEIDGEITNQRIVYLRAQ